GHREGKKIVVTVDSPCSKVQNLAKLEVPIKEILDIKENYVINQAQAAQCSSNCLVPCAILNVCRMEAGYIAKSLWQEAGGLEIVFEA
ncbi:MAG: hypothetical protein MJ157_04845, partial [Clostridia bacterium]|nr:hypothetical protein [Clostridia bacterium]